MKKIVYIVVDGLADLPIDGKTPLSAAKKPNIDWLAKNGVTGFMNLVPKNLPVWTHIANISMLGYDPKKVYHKRGPLEAVGSDIPLQEGHLALRCNFATVDDSMNVVDRRAGRNDYGLNEIVQYINSHVDIGVPYTFLRTYGHRAVLILKMNLSDAITDNDPGVNGKKIIRITGLNSEGMYSAKLVQQFVDKVYELIKYHPKNAERKQKGIPPANYLLVREAGNRVQAFPKFLKSHKLKKTAVVAEPGATKGIFMLAGFDATTVPETDFEESLEFIFDNIHALLPDYQLIVAHIKGPDEAAHDGNFDRKKKMIEAIDEHLAEFRNKNIVVVLTPDHITSTENMKHEHGPVPFLVYGKGKDKVKTFDEMSVKKGKLKNYTPKKLLNYILK